MPLMTMIWLLPSLSGRPPQPIPSKWKWEYSSPVSGWAPPNKKQQEVPPSEAGMRSGRASAKAPKMMSVMRGLTSVLPPTSAAGNSQFTTVPGGATMFIGR